MTTEELSDYIKNNISEQFYCEIGKINIEDVLFDDEVK